MAKETESPDAPAGGAPQTEPERAETESLDGADPVADSGTADTNGATAESAADVPEEDELSSTRKALNDAELALVEARAEVEALKDQALRAAAETENVRKRADRSIENAHKYALERFVGELLPAVDSFERAVSAAAEAKSAAGEAVDAMAEGVELSLKLLVEAMERQGIAVVDPIGAPFDPKLHEAMSMLENPDAEPGSVIEVFQKGYTVNDRLVRPARVIVAREPAARPPSEASDEDAPKP